MVHIQTHNIFIDHHNYCKHNISLKSAIQNILSLLSLYFAEMGITLSLLRVYLTPYKTQTHKFLIMPKWQIPFGSFHLITTNNRCHCLKQ